MLTALRLSLVLPVGALPEGAHHADGHSHGHAAHE